MLKTPARRLAFAFAVGLGHSRRESETTGRATRRPRYAAAVKRRSVFELVFGAIAAFTAAYWAPRELEFLERGVIYALLFGAAWLTAYLLDEALPRRRPPDA